ncbi:MAG TPA: ABATE domain-containing protein [Thermoleophilaceae bacterium]|jgi:predicted RNA-binding Zn ribbon-like protein|nr:ABATE domain-containing protein [Thermoleophilaceae bacterium]
MTHEALPWLGFPPTVDLANTVMVTLAGELDLLEDEGQLGAWIAAERGRIVGVEAASGRLPEVRALRETVRELLHARERRAPPEEARRRVNAICASVPVRAVLTDEGRAVEEPDARDTYALFESTVSHSAVELADRDEERLSVCGAPSCGMLFLRDHPRQVWCSKACGNRARVARHAARRRRPSEPRER